ncbi:MAG: DNA polymerase I [Lachnospiraceae bacterium]|nr:DNA polymerase I [Lachnospiraceae bacterium]
MASKILLIDGHSILNRAFYGMPDLTNSKGVHTGAVLGFINIISKIIADEKPDHLLCAFDEHAPTFRHELFKEYKGTRHAMPDELKEQVPLIKELLISMGVTVISKPGLEADDIIGTVANRAENLGIESTILSGDRDLLQLVTEKTKMLLPKTVKGETSVISYYPEDVLRDYQVEPKGIIELKALEGDKSDNIPGVPRIGTKTAAELIVKYKTIENLKSHIEEVTKKSIRESLEQNFDMAELSHTLATINTESDIEFDPDECKFETLFTNEAYEKAKELELNSLLKKFPAEIAEESEENDKVEYATVTDLGEAEEIFARIKTAERSAFAIELNEEKRISGLYMIFDKTGYYIESSGFISPMFLSAHIKSLTEDSKGKVFCVNTKTLFKVCDIEDISKLYDVELLMYLNDPVKNGYNIPEEAEKAAYFAYDRGEEFLSKVKDLGMEKLFEDIERPLSRVLASMELYGIRVKRETLKSFSALLGEKMDSLYKNVTDAAGMEFNLNSPKQLSEVLFEKLKLPGGKKTKTGYSTNASVLEKLRDEHPIVKDILEYRTVSKLKATYADGLTPFIQEEDRIHSTFNQTITATGRISSQDPNLQNIPIRTELGRELRKAFIPKDGYVFIDADYSQIELRIMASLSGDEKLIGAYKREADIHAITASEVFHVPLEEVSSEMRRNAKAVNFGIIYGISAFGLSEDLSISRAQAQEYISKYFETYPDVKVYIDSLVSEAKKTGYAKTYFGRLRPIPELKDSKFMVRSFGERVAMNAPIQGTAADIIKIAMVSVFEELKKRKLKSRLILQVHDELLIETALDEVDMVTEILKEKMMNAASLPVPLEVEIKSGSDWLESH